MTQPVSEICIPKGPAAVTRVQHGVLGAVRAVADHPGVTVGLQRYLGLC